MAEPDIRWSSPEYHYREKDVGWYYAVIIAAILLAAAGLWKANFLFALFTLIAAGLMISWGRRVPHTIDFTLSPQGLDLGGKKRYTLDELAGFAIAPDRDRPDFATLAVRTKGRLGYWIKIIIAAQRADGIKAFLIKSLPELEYQQSLADHLAKRIGF